MQGSFLVALTDIIGTGTNVPDSNTITTISNLMGATRGQWHVVVENLDGQICSAPITFTVAVLTGMNSYLLIVLAMMYLALGTFVLRRSWLSLKA